MSAVSASCRRGRVAGGGCRNNPIIIVPGVHVHNHIHTFFAIIFIFLINASNLFSWYAFFSSFMLIQCTINRIM